LGSDTSCRPFPLRRERAHRSSRLFDYRGWRRFGRAAIKERFRRIDHVKLDGLCRLFAAQFSCEP
jgi:hypothetical protein